VYDLVYLLKMAENFDMDSSFSSGLDTNFNSKVLPVLLSKGEISTSRIEQHYSQPGNEMEKTLSELAETNNDDDLLYPPSVMQSSVCVANCKNKCRGNVLSVVKKILSEDIFPNQGRKSSPAWAWMLSRTNICSQ
jgi:hypothetical protein